MSMARGEMTWRALSVCHALPRGQSAFLKREQLSGRRVIAAELAREIFEFAEVAFVQPTGRCAVLLAKKCCGRDGYAMLRAISHELC